MDFVLTLPCNSSYSMEREVLGCVATDASPQKRTKSSVFKSIIPGNHRRKPSSKTLDQPYRNNDGNGMGEGIHAGNQSLLPPDHPHTRQHLKEDNGNRGITNASPKKSVEAWNDTKSDLKENQRVTRSASFKSFVGKEKEKPPKKESQKEEANKMKSKSSTGISAILSRPRSSRGFKAEETHRQKDKENQTPPSSEEMAPPPIWAQFATQGFEEPAPATKIPLNDRFAVEEEVALYMPRDYSPSKQRNFQDYQQPTLSRRAELKPRPKSDHIVPCPASASFAGAVSGLQKSGRNKSQVDISNQQPQTVQAADASWRASAKENVLSTTSSSAPNRQVNNGPSGSNLPMPKSGSRVMAAVAAFNGKAKELPKEPPKDTETVHLDPKTIEIAFESLLVSRVQRWLNSG